MFEIQHCFYSRLEMGKCKRMETANGEIPPPEAMIQHIQSFMSAKEAARSTLLSKSWYDAWLTRPTIDFDEEDFKTEADGVFEEFAEKTMQRYQDSSFKIQRFSLCSPNNDMMSDTTRHNLIVNAMKMGASHLQLDLHMEFTLPQEVLQSKTLLKLSINNCRCDESYVISCSALKSLTLGDVDFDGDDLFKDIILCCISIEELSLSNFHGFRLGQGIIINELHKLRSLSMCDVEVDPLIFTNFGSRFPRLMDLSVHRCYGCRRIDIASTSLQTLSIMPRRIKYQRGKFDVPNIRKFTISLCSLPYHLSITGAFSWEWELDISITCYGFPDSSWFMNLKKKLKKFRLSRISLFIDLRIAHQWIPDTFHTVDVEVIPKPLVVENLMIAAPATLCCALILGSFQAFRPKYITLCDCRNSYDPTKLNKPEAIDNFRNRLIEALFVTNWQDKFEQFGLKKVKVNAEIDKEFDTEWRPLELLKASEDNVRLHLIWED